MITRHLQEDEIFVGERATLSPASYPGMTLNCLDDVVKVYLIILGIH